MTPDDEAFLRHAVALADRAGASGERPFASLLVGPDGSVLIEDHNTVVSDSDVTAHPELKLARWAARELAPDVAAGTTMYTSCQPCPMCATAIGVSGLGRVVYALSSEQFAAVKPATPAPPPVRYEGPALFDEARRPIEDHY
ncbi:tRNA(Arg) A34 adenosine deaminase TadA [Micromonospora sediminicola]|jgi:tRNA(Arg) A34 adenosine deaminase TadA|uniref:tRNA(Arg) A34 adenosine deaminase TadA n=1 Tax=Micromonospora sediminicola TaxID=946078 RepID=A0A1A9B6Y6_9ACTN|nr:MULTISPECIES: nucleoside deaminase [Micromonospora]PGH42343.1 nucleoside deaminase [Micromonospora sp. WMMA1996]SBT64858.1 tRNA(Arg) A34 adenosine deaminase TadA [Micromonospora sediminicola]